MSRTWAALCAVIVILATAFYARAQYGDVGGFGGPVSGSGGGGGGGSGTVSPGTIGDMTEYTGSTTIGDTGVAWPLRLDQLGSPAQADYDAGGFFTILHNGTYQQIGATLVYGSPNEQLNGITVPHFLAQTACASESVNAGGTTTATVGSDGGGAFLTLSQALTSIPDIGTAIDDTTAGKIVQVCGGSNSNGLCTGTTGTSTTSKIYVSSTTGITTGDTVVTGMAMICTTPANAQPYEGLIVGGALDQTTQTFTLPANWISAPFLPGVPAAGNPRIVGVWFYPNTSGVATTYTFSWTTPANGSFVMARVGNVNLGAPFENTSGFISATTGTTAGLGGILNNATTDLFASFVTQNTGATLTLPTAPTQGKGIIEDVYYGASGGSNIPAGACDNVDQNSYGYTPPYNNTLFTDPQWGGTYQRMIRNGPGGNVDHNFYYSRNSWNSNHTLMLGLQTPPSANGTGSPWVMALFDANGCFLKPLFNAVGAQPTFNWRVAWSKTDPNIFYTGGSGTAGTWPGLGNLHNTDLYAMHPCASANTGVSDSACTGTATLVVQDIFSFTPSLATGSNYISTNEPTGPSLNEAGNVIGLVTRPNSATSGDYYWSSLALTSSTTVNPSSLTTYDISTGVPSNYCHQSTEVEKDRYIGQGDLFQVAVYHGSGTPSCSVAAQDAGMQVVDSSTGTQHSFIAQDVNAPWFNGGGHETWSPTISGAPGNGYFCYAHVAGATSYSASCTATSNIATCTTTNGANFPVWPIGTIVQGKGFSPSGYNVFGATTSAGGGTSISYNIGTTPGAGTGGTIVDGNQWEEHCIGTNGSSDVTNFVGVDALSGQTVHAFWPWGSTANGGTATDFYYTGYAYDGLTQYPTTAITTCTHSGTTVTCNIGSLPSGWISPQQNNGLGSLGGSTVYVSGVSDGVDQCYNGGFPITHTTSTSFQYTSLCTPGANATGGTAYVGPTDEVYKCYVGDATYGNGCVPQLRTYSAQVTSDFYFQPLPNGDQEGDLVEFDSAPGVVPVNQYGKLNDAKTLLPSTTPPYNATAFYTYGSISPSGTFDSTASGTWSGVTVALQGNPGVGPLPVYNPITGALSGQGNQFQNGAPPIAIGDAEIEGGPIGAIVPTPAITTDILTLVGPYTAYTCNTALIDTLSTDSAGNLWFCNGSAWAQIVTGGGGIKVTALTAGSTVTMVATSSTIPFIDTETFSPTANATVTTPAASAMANGEQIIFEAENSGSARTITFAAGASVSLATIQTGDSVAVGVGKACTPPATGQTWYRFQWDSGTGLFTMLDCGTNPSGAVVPGIATTITTSVSGATNLTPSAAFWATNQDVTMTASATLTLVAPSFADQSELFKICQNGTGGFTPTLSAGGGLTITGTLPTCTTTASKCCDFGLFFDSSSTAYVTGFNNSIN